MKESEHVASFFAAHPALDTPANRKTVEEVNRRIDQFAHFPREATLLGHRRFLHHREDLGALAAEQHVREDCGHVPRATDSPKTAVFDVNRESMWISYCLLSAGVLVLDQRDPRAIRYRSSTPILRPETAEERRGTVADVVFPTGADPRGGVPPQIDIYYGMADARIGAARLLMPQLG